MIEATKQVCNYHNINQEFMMSITLLNDMGPQNIVVRCWEFNINLSLLTQNFQVSYYYILRVHKMRVVRKILLSYLIFLHIST